MTRLSKATKALQMGHDSQHSRPDYLHIPNKAEIKRLVDQYVDADLAGDSAWTKIHEIPTEAEIGWIENGDVKYQDFHVPVSKMNGAYESKERYLETQYKLMRMDGTMPLARCVDDYRQGNFNPESNDYRIYDEVFVTSIAVARDGLALSIEFSAVATGTLVRWAKSKRLRSGSLVALTPASDRFKTKCVPAIIASRLLENLDVKPPAKPSIFIYIGDADQIDIDPQQKWTMIECTQGYWEAYHHTLKALQKISFPMQEYLVDVKSDVEAPKYRLEDPLMNIDFVSHDKSIALHGLNVLGDWPDFQETGAPNKDPTKISSDMDTSQIEALKRILTKKLAIVQGPPGTGKTFTSVCAIKILLDNMTENDSPIIIAAQTNHAVDQILRHISNYEPKFVRLGGQTTDQEIIKPRTLYALKEAGKQQTSASTRQAVHLRKVIGNELEKLLVPLQLEDVITAEMFFDHGLLTESQRDSINSMESKWVADDSPNKMNLWCNNELTAIVNQDSADTYYDQLQEEHENLDEQELEGPDNEDDKFEQLPGRRFELFTGYSSSSRQHYIGDEELNSLLAKNEDLLAISKEYRPAIYSFLRRQLTQKITEKVRLLGHRCKHAATTARKGRWESDYNFLNSAKVIGLTTTGLSKYRGLLSLLKPKIVLVEEAAETLEPYTAAAVFDSLEHFILVGDHQQLRANCSYADLIGYPVNFDISLFERLVKNDLEFSRLNRQRRMRPEIRHLIKHIYPDLVDHSSVMERGDINGLDGSNVWFWHHGNEESVDEAKSKQNVIEAKMIVEFVNYLIWNNISLKQITVLTFYNGQKKILLELFHRHKLLKSQRVKVCTVDSYQGEENDIVLLSLVRNNYNENIGFLSSINRACVALSRARDGFYIFGNAKLLINSDHWAAVISELQLKDAVRTYLPLYCPVHDTMLDVRTFTELEALHGGCDIDCKKQLKCGHECPLKCHPARDCSSDDCEEPCPLTLACGHPCVATCADSCECRLCLDSLWSPEMPHSLTPLHNGTAQTQSRLDDGENLKQNVHVGRPERQTREALQCPLNHAMSTPAEAAQQTKKWSDFVRSELKPNTSMAKSKYRLNSDTSKKYPVHSNSLLSVRVPKNDVQNLEHHGLCDNGQSLEQHQRDRSETMQNTSKNKGQFPGRSSQKLVDLNVDGIAAGDADLFEGGSLI